MFPLSKRRPNKPDIGFLLKNRKMIFPVGDCKKGLTGMYQDAINLSHLNLDLDDSGDRIAAVFKENYKKHHEPYVEKYGDFNGLAFIFLPKRYFPLPEFVGGDQLFGFEINRGVILVQAGYEDQGVFLHELTHVFGQRKEYYRIQNEPYYCDQFTPLGELPGKSSTGVPCPDYRVTGGLALQLDLRPRLSQEPRRQVWRLLNNQKSIMHGSDDKIRDIAGFYQKWIDRETRQKVLAVLQNNLIIPWDFFERIKGQAPGQRAGLIQIKESLENKAQCGKKPVISVSGIYDKTRKAKGRLSDFSIKAYRLKNKQNPFSKGRFFIEEERQDADYVNVQLKRRGVLEEELVFPRKGYMEIFYKGGHIKKQEMDSFPLFAPFFLPCASFNEKGWTISIKESYMEGGKRIENILIDSAPAVWEPEGIDI